MFDITDEIIQNHIDKLCDVIDNIKMNKVTVLVGPNGVGKSLIRKQLHVRVYREHNCKKEYGARHVSMELRTSANLSMGALSRLANDTDWTPTSTNTYDLIRHMFENINDDDKHHYYVIDEPDIGMSRESELGIAEYIIKRMKDIEDYTLGGMIITHSEIIAERIVNAGADFIYIDYNDINNDFEKWKTREAEPTDFEWLKEWSEKLFVAIRDRSAPVKQ